MQTDALIWKQQVSDNSLQVPIFYLEGIHATLKNNQK